MKKKLIFLLILCLTITINCLGQNYWMQKAGGATIDAGTDIAIDAQGNTYATGYFTSQAT